jgi:hypothetical protein
MNKFAGSILMSTIITAGFVMPAQGFELADSKLSIHGYLNQAFAISDGYQYLGINDNGTADYRTAALQFRYAVTDQDQLVLQLSHERLGDSKINDLHDDVEWDWAFYQHTFDIGTLSSSATFNALAPYAGVGWSSGTGKSGGLSFAFDIGILFQGSPSIENYHATGSVADDPAFQDDVDKEVAKLEDDLDSYKFYPVAALTLTYRF